MDFILEMLEQEISLEEFLRYEILLNDYQYRRIMAWLTPQEWAQDSYQQRNICQLRSYLVSEIGCGGKGHYPITFTRLRIA